MPRAVQGDAMDELKQWAGCLAVSVLVAAVLTVWVNVAPRAM